MLKYEVWNKTKLGSRSGLPERTHYMIDTSMESAKELSRGTHKQSVYNPNKKIPGQAWDGGYDEIQMPNMIAVIERGDKQSTIRGWGIAGKWKDACDCKRCNNTGEEPDGVPCRGCSGASFKPSV